MIRRPYRFTAISGFAHAVLIPFLEGMRTVKLLAEPLGKVPLLVRTAFAARVVGWTF